MAEETTASLSRAHGFAVAVLARDSVFNLAQRGLTAQQIGRELKADLVLTGTLQAFSSHYRLRAEMIRVEDGTQIWVEDLLVPQNQTGVLEQGLIDFPGCAMVISHDRFFLDRICTHLLILEGDGKTRWFEGNFQAYEEKMLAQDAEHLLHRRGKYKRLSLR